MTDQTMIDRVSKAIDAAIDRYFAEWEKKAGEDPTVIPWIGMADIPREVFARAAIEEMRDPTTYMLKEAAKAEVLSEDYEYNVQLGEDKAYTAWIYMIDAALEGPPVPPDWATEVSKIMIALDADYVTDIAPKETP